MHKTILKRLFNKWHKSDCTKIEQLPLSGSDRIYFRLYADKISVIGTFSAISAETESFCYLSEHFLTQGINVPEIYIRDENYYLQSDFGDNSLFSIINSRTSNKLNSSHMELYKKSLAQLFKMQHATKGLNFSKCYPTSSFDRESINYDLEYFQKYCINQSGINYSIEKLESEFNKITNHLLSDKSGFFMFRDFQSRNILIENDKPYFIDYQGGRKGFLQYDIASLLWQVKANIPDTQRYELAKYYFNILAKQDNNISYNQFIDSLHGFVFIRMMQTLGAYGFRGIIEGKEYFLKYIPQALINIKDFVNNDNVKFETPYLFEIINKIDSHNLIPN